MLLLTRRTNESIVITIGGEQAKVTVLGIKGNQVRIGIHAPPSVTVDREEIAAKKEQETLRDRVRVERASDDQSLAEKAKTRGERLSGQQNDR